MLDLKLSIKTKSFRKESDEVFDDYDYQEARPLALKRDNFTCQGCGFKSISNKTAEHGSLEYSGFLEIHHKDDDHTNNHLDNLVTVCPFCHQVFHFGFAGNRGAGLFIYLPEISQAEINRLSIFMAVSFFRKNDFFTYSKNIYQFLKEQSEKFEDIFSEKSSNPAIFSLAMQSADASVYNKVDKILEGVRLLPLIEPVSSTVFLNQITYWAKNVVPDNSEWKEIYDGFLKKENLNINM